MEVENIFFNTSDYKITTKKLGEGAYGTVFVAKNIKNNKKYASKVIRIDGGFDGHEQMQFLRESLILHKLNHPSIVKFIGINFKSFSHSKILQPTIITEYLPHGSLKYNLNKESKSLADHEWTPTIKYINLLGITDALRYLHEQGIAHRDLKPENILLDSNYYPRICDFGLSKCFPNSLSKSTKLTMSGQFGTPLYLPPEVLRGESSYDQSVDVYAFAMIAYEIITGKVPFSELGESISPLVLIQRIVDGYRPKFTSFVPTKMQKLIAACWSDAPEERPTFDEIFNELSSDVTYFSESVDEDQVQEYLDKLLDSRSSRVKKHKSKNQSIEKELKELKDKLFEYKTEHETLLSSNESLYLGLVSLLDSKKVRNTKNAVQQLKFSSKKGNRYASFVLGLLFEAGEEVRGDIEESFKYYEEAAKQGDSNGFRRIGLCFENGKKVNQSYAKAFEFYAKAAELQNAGAMRNLGVLYEAGKGVEQDYERAVECYEKAVRLGNDGALNNLGALYEGGRGTMRDVAKAVECYEKAAAKGSKYALERLKALREK